MQSYKNPPIGSGIKKSQKSLPAGEAGKTFRIQKVNHLKIIINLSGARDPAS